MTSGDTELQIVFVLRIALANSVSLKHFVFPLHKMDGKLWLQLFACNMFSPSMTLGQPQWLQLPRNSRKCIQAAYIHCWNCKSGLNCLFNMFPSIFRTRKVPWHPSFSENISWEHLKRRGLNLLSCYHISQRRRPRLTVVYFTVVMNN